MQILSEPWKKRDRSDCTLIQVVFYDYLYILVFSFLPFLLLKLDVAIREKYWLKYVNSMSVASSFTISFCSVFW